MDPPPTPAPCWSPQQAACPGSDKIITFTPEGAEGADVGTTMTCTDKAACDAAVEKAESGGWNRFTVDPGSCESFALGEDTFKWTTTTAGVDCQTEPTNPCNQVGIFPGFG